MKEADLVVIGGGPAGLAAAAKAKELGADDIILIERGERLGGILNQCIHDGFGVEIFKKAYTGPEFAQKYIDRIGELGVECMLDSTVVDLTPDKVLTVQSPKGLFDIKANAIIVTTGCRERTREMIRIPGSRPAGVYTAGSAQNIINLLGYMVGKKVVILGSGDIGLIMARRMTLEGADVLAVVEIMPYSSGLQRNIVQCLEDYGIPLYLKHTVTEIRGNKRLEGLTIAEVDDKFQPIEGTEKEFQCDTLLLSVGLIPENELAEKAGAEMDPRTRGPVVNEANQTSVEGLYSAGNSLQVHDLVDWAALEGENAAKHAVEYVKEGKTLGSSRKTAAGDGVLQVVPQRYSGEEEVTLSLRVRNPYSNKNLIVKDGEREVKREYHVKMLPAEMIRVKITEEEAKAAKEMRVYVED
ncbi:MAG: FAD-binding protein [Candidatus Altiarchaeales archaeon]|nr:FAD-binding protein [Candidatus Altiarchaeales archaeon]MBD3416819.1 FAD-binding protein [Candidatus Altiarchaeales archaeon]